MNKWYLALILASLFSGCVEEPPASDLLPAGSGMKKISTSRIPATRLTIYEVSKILPDSQIAGYPLNAWSDENWKVRRWTKGVKGKELADLVKFLKFQKGQYRVEDQHQAQVRILTQLIEELSNGVGDKSRLAYFYNDRPGTSQYLLGNWLYLYYMDLESGRVIEITNAFR